MKKVDYGKSGPKKKVDVRTCLPPPPIGEHNGWMETCPHIVTL
jgi:hypothetical protein